MRPPDITGKGGRAWVVGRPDDDPVDTNATIACYLLNVPGAHPFWSWWTLTIVHLRDIPGQKRPPLLHFPEAAYEFLILSVDPERSPNPDPDDARAIHFMEPADIVEQFGGLDDDGARKLAMMSATIICRGQASPDSDWRAWWKRAIRSSVEHQALGGHPTAKA